MTGAGGYLQNYVNGYAGLRYTGDGLALRPVLPPHGCESLALRGTTLIGPHRPPRLTPVHAPPVRPWPRSRPAFAPRSAPPRTAFAWPVWCALRGVLYLMVLSMSASSRWCVSRGLGCARTVILSGLSLAGRRVTVLYTGTVLTATLTDGGAGPLSIGVVGGGAPTTLVVGVPKTFPIPKPGQTVFAIKPLGKL